RGSQGSSRRSAPPPAPPVTDAPPPTDEDAPFLSEHEGLRAARQREQQANATEYEARLRGEHVATPPPAAAAEPAPTLEAPEQPPDLAAPPPASPAPASNPLGQEAIGVVPRLAPEHREEILREFEIPIQSKAGFYRDMEPGAGEAL